ncbi:DNA-3-methyladenine glycosylase I [Denitrificimonas caeni]|uniref:DNA-3-methyladenine glycosylase I n=1 Tax=Denitrificimonas caeni TaxID=521720 RepID=A0AAF0AHS0_9GAMM|nr:DNA-3-methyladenine glycosylase I [Denitrificimonas caeni]WBE24234.1 DNA-3-methyladenine glycosylase I [Denitrificimonas caeni]
MQDFQWMLEYGINRFGSLAALEARLPQPATAAQLTAVSDDRYLSLLALRVFRAGLRHSVVDAKWPNFEEVFWQFNPDKVVLMSAEHIERLMQDTRIIRHLGKLRSVPRNAQMVLDMRREYGSFGAFLAQWPSSDIVGLWRYLAKQGQQLGGMSAPRFLRMAGKDTFLLSNDVTAALIAQGIVTKQPTSQRDLAAVQEAFNSWQAQSGRPLCQLSMLLALTTNH